MAVIRAAQHSDLDAIVAMGERFYRETSYRHWADFCADSSHALCALLIDTGVLLVACSGERPVGMVGLAVAPFMFNSSIRAAYEVFWWVEPEARGGLLAWRLLRAIEPACLERGCSAIQMSALSTSPNLASEMYARAGYAHSETSFTKIIRSK